MTIRLIAGPADGWVMPHRTELDGAVVMTGSGGVATHRAIHYSPLGPAADGVEEWICDDPGWGVLFIESVPPGGIGGWLDRTAARAYHETPAFILDTSMRTALVVARGLVEAYRIDRFGRGEWTPVVSAARFARHGESFKIPPIDPTLVVDFFRCHTNLTFAIKDMPDGVVVARVDHD